ncbi:ER membrane protein complex subunit 4-like [Mytilus galloprovincialis]|uniref:ER membrane protein complex subunit 4 n=1 Tax=Mytilus galloprovincialis TaxID=29158 RepID=A0A8B6EDA1_MYTGA|nr:Hypothetical predicted protein [Mytilus galloprovincialis]
MSRRKLHKWSIDFTGIGRPKGEKALVQLNTDLRKPMGYNEDATVARHDDKEDSPDTQKLIDKRSWDIALGPIKQIPMNFFIMWMAGNSISIFPIMMVGMMFFRPFQALISIQATFGTIEGSSSYLQKAVYILGNIVCLVLAVYKCQVMGLLPTHSSDWLAFVEAQHRMEWSGGGAAL